jgi:hypothetical protein
MIAAAGDRSAREARRTSSAELRAADATSRVVRAIDTLAADLGIARETIAGAINALCLTRVGCNVACNVAVASPCNVASPVDVASCGQNADVVPPSTSKPLRALTSTERSRNRRARLQAQRDAVACNVAPPVSFSLLASNQERKKTNTAPARSNAGGDEGFESLWQLVPFEGRGHRHEAQRAYAAATAEIGEAAVIAAYQRYLADIAKTATATWKQAPRFLANWLRAKPWLDEVPQGPPKHDGHQNLGQRDGSPQGTSHGPPTPKRPAWIEIAREYTASGTWPTGVGPAPHEAGCQMTPTLLCLPGVRRQIERVRQRELRLLTPVKASEVAA